jgi:hypothetical protein
MAETSSPSTIEAYYGAARQPRNLRGGREETHRSRHTRTGVRPVLSSELLKNYRSHPDILSVFNRLFYSNRLESAAEFDKLTLVSCSFQRNKTFPLVFIDVPPHGGPHRPT